MAYHTPLSQKTKQIGSCIKKCSVVYGHILRVIRKCYPYLAPSLSYTAPPIIIGATGGSGTRVLQTLLDKSGAYMGCNVNVAGDAMFIDEFMNQAINLILPHTRSLDYRINCLPPALAARLLKELKTLICDHYLEKPPQVIRWGWKHPRNIYILPFIKALFPDFYFIHVVRDGRDMAFSNNQSQPMRHYEALFDESYEMLSPAASIRQWAKANQDVANWCVYPGHLAVGVSKMLSW